MKVAIIGAGNVGKAVFHDLQHVNLIREITLIDRNKTKAEAEVMDAKDAAILWEESGAKLDSGGYEKTKGADIIVNGIEDILEVTMTDEERDAFHISIDTIRQAAKSEGIIG